MTEALTLRSLAQLSFFTLLVSLYAVGPAQAEGSGSKEEVSLKYFDLLEGQLLFTYTPAEDSIEPTPGESKWEQPRIDESKKEAPKQEIRLIDFATLETKKIAAGGSNNSNPRWSPDNSSILFDSNRSGTSQIYTISADGTGLRTLTSDSVGAGGADWAPDGKRFVYESITSSKGKEIKSGIVIQGLDGSGKQFITQSEKQNFSPRWAPKNAGIIFNTNEYWPGNDLLYYRFDTKKVTILTTGYESSTQAAWSPSGEQIAFCFGGIAKDRGKPIVTRPARDCEPEWIDEERLMFAGETEPKSGRFEIFLVNVKTQELVQVTDSLGSVRSPSWNPKSPRSLAVASPTPTPLLAVPGSPVEPEGERLNPSVPQATSSSAASTSTGSPTATVESSSPASTPTGAAAGSSTPAGDGGSSVLPPYAEGL